MFILSTLKVGVFISIISRLFYLQISENIKYRSLSDKNRFREWKLVPQRGIIEDFFGEKIADNTQTFQLHMIPEDVPNMEELFFKLSKMIDFNARKRSNLIKRLKKRRPWETVIVSDNLSWSEFSKLNLFLYDMQGVKPVVALARKYSEDGSSSHIVGYVSDTSVTDLENSALLREINVPGLKTGKNGLEKLLNNEIIGRPGIQRFEVNAFGKRIKELKLVKGTKCKICCTRKTIPNLRVIQKYAVKLGGGTNHRFNLSDEYLIKDNHIATSDIKNLVNLAIKNKKGKKITVEVDSLVQLKKILGLKFNTVLFDNMNIKNLKTGVKIAKEYYETEASGNINLKNVKKVAATGVSRISVGAITHSAPAIDLKFEILK